jgi:hypothetical protein
LSRGRGAHLCLPDLDLLLLSTPSKLSGGEVRLRLVGCTRKSGGRGDGEQAVKVEGEVSERERKKASPGGRKRGRDEEEKEGGKESKRSASPLKFLGLIHTQKAGGK